MIKSNSSLVNTVVDHARLFAQVALVFLLTILSFAFIATWEDAKNIEDFVSGWESSDLLPPIAGTIVILTVFLILTSRKK